MMKNKLMLAVMTVLFTIGLSPLASYADTVTFSLSNPNQTVVAGGTVTFQATVTADAGNSGTIFLNTDTFNGTNPLNPGDVYVDDTDFFNNFFPLSFNPGDSITDALFTVTLPSTAPVGYDFTGTFQLQGGNDFATFDDFGTVNFSVTVVPASPIPEPSSLMLLGTGLAGVFGVCKRKAFQFGR